MTPAPLTTPSFRVRAALETLAREFRQAKRDNVKLDDLLSGAVSVKGVTTDLSQKFGDVVLVVKLDE